MSFSKSFNPRSLGFDFDVNCCFGARVPSSPLGVPHTLLFSMFPSPLFEILFFLAFFQVFLPVEHISSSPTFLAPFFTLSLESSILFPFPVKIKRCLQFCKWRPTPPFFFLPSALLIATFNGTFIACTRLHGAGMVFLFFTWLTHHWFGRELG